MFHNIERNPTSTRTAWPYIGYAANGRKYYINRIQLLKGGGDWRAAVVISTPEDIANDIPPYFYARTLKDVSAKLETIR